MCIVLQDPHCLSGVVATKYYCQQLTISEVSEEINAIQAVHARSQVGSSLVTRFQYHLDLHLTEASVLTSCSDMVVVSRLVLLISYSASSMVFHLSPLLRFSYAVAC